MIKKGNKVYIIKIEKEHKICKSDNDKSQQVIILKNDQPASCKNIIELTHDDYAFILDALYEQAKYQEDVKGGNKRYAKGCRKTAKKFEEAFK